MYSNMLYNLIYFYDGIVGQNVFYCTKGCYSTDKWKSIHKRVGHKYVQNWNRVVSASEAYHDIKFQSPTFQSPIPCTSLVPSFHHVCKFHQTPFTKSRNQLPMPCYKMLPYQIPPKPVSQSAIKSVTNFPSIRNQLHSNMNNYATAIKGIGHYW